MMSHSQTHRRTLSNSKPIVVGILLGSIGHVAFVGATAPESSSDTPASTVKVIDEDAEGRARLLGMLMLRSVTIDFDDVPAQEALTKIAEQSRIPIVPRWLDDSAHGGMDREARVSILLNDVSALEALEATLASISAAPLHDECTWQLRRGFVEVGTKARLGVPAARDTRLYDIGDMLIEPPTFSSDDSALVRAFRKGLNHNAPDQRARPDDEGSTRKTPQAIAVEIIQEVCETIEPGHWDFGQPLSRELDDDRLVPLPEGGAASTSGSSGGSPHGAAASPAAASPSGAPVAASIADAWASIRLWRTQLIVTAPDFIHRQVGGYPKPIPPDDADDALLRGKDDLP